MTVPAGWKEKRLDQWGTIVSGATPSTTVANLWDGDIIWVTPFDLSRLTTPFLADSSKRITEAGLKACSAQMLPAGSVVLSSRAPIGYVALPVVPFCTNQGCKSVKMNDDVSSAFAYYNILFNIDKIRSLGEGTTFAEISKSALSAITLTFPTNTVEQTKIAEILSAVDQAIEHTEAFLDKQCRINIGLMQVLLHYGIDEHDRIRSEETHPFKDSIVGRVPAEWNTETLATCARSDSPICYGILMPGPNHDNGVPVIKVRDIFGGKILRSNILLTDPRIDNQYKRSRLRARDVLITIRGTTGRVALVPDELDGANITQDTARVRLKGNHSPLYFYFLLHSKAVQDQVALHTIGQAVKGINIGDVKKITFALPNKQEQDIIAARLHEAQTVANCTESHLEKLRSLKTALMQDLLSGRKRVTTLLEQESGQEKKYAVG